MLLLTFGLLGVDLGNFFFYNHINSLKIGPLFKELSEKYHEKIVFLKIDTDALEELCDSLNIQSMPTFIVFKNGKEVERWTGGVFETLSDKVKKYAS
jgi:thioredoxin 1